MSDRPGGAPSISVIIPVYNGERYIGEALESVLRQSLAATEVLVVDDGSTDRTAERVAEHGDRVRYLAQANAGPTVARNRGVRETSGELIAFLDADDWWAEDKLERQAAALEDQSLGFVVGHVQNVWMEEMADEAARYASRPRGAPVPGYVTQALLVRRSVHQALGGFDEALPHSDSMDFFMRAEAAGIRGRCLEEVVVYRRMHDENMSRRESAEHLNEVFALLRKRVRSRSTTTDADGGDPA